MDIFVDLHLHYITLENLGDLHCIYAFTSHLQCIKMKCSAYLHFLMGDFMIRLYWLVI